MKPAFLLVLISFTTLTVSSQVIVPERRQNSNCDPNGWVQKPSGHATFSSIHTCATPSCGVNFTSGFTAGVNGLAFGSKNSYGDACGRCFQITATKDPFDPGYQGPFGNSIVLKVNNLCLNIPTLKNNWCGQTVSKPKNEFNVSMHFELCDLSGAPQAFFPGGRHEMYGNYQEVPCTSWKGSAGTPLWTGSCMADENAAFWPAMACGNEGSAPC